LRVDHFEGSEKVQPGLDRLKGIAVALPKVGDRLPALQTLQDFLRILAESLSQYVQCYSQQIVAAIQNAFDVLVLEVQLKARCSWVGCFVVATARKVRVVRPQG
jgi:hypothetical protein